MFAMRDLAHRLQLRSRGRGEPMVSFKATESSIGVGTKSIERCPFLNEDKKSRRGDGYDETNSRQR